MNEDILEDISSAKVYSTKTIVVSSFFGGFYIGSYMLYQNFKTFGEYKKAAATIVITISAFIILVSTALLPAMEKVPGVFYSIFLTLAISLLSKKYQGDLIQEHLNKGGKLYSSGRALVVCLIGIAILVALVLGAFYLTDMPL